MRNRKRIFSFAIYLYVSVFLGMNFVNAFEFNGSIYDTNSIALNNSVINITVRSMTDFSIVGYNFTTTNASGWFNMTVNENALWMYEPVIFHRNTTFTPNYIDYVGQSLPAFPAQVYSQLSGTFFYLRDGGTINITAINSTADRVMFNYQIKDTKLGYPVAESMGTGGTVLEANIMVPRDRNYSIMIFPNQSLPVSFDWNNFTTASSYTIVESVAGNISKYNVTTKTLHKQFNITLSLPRVTGLINASNSSAVAGWDEFTVVPFLVEPGNIIQATHGGMPSNMSSFVGSSDGHNLSTGFYNLSLPASAEGVDYLLFATARNGSLYFGGVANLTLTYGAANTMVNLTMYGMVGKPSNFSLPNAANFANRVNVATAKQNFQAVNASNQSILQAFVHAEITVNYSKFAAVNEFTWVEDVPQESSGNFTVALLNITGVKEINIFVGGGNYAPKRVAPTITQLISENGVNGNASNISVKTFNPQAIDSQLQASAISMALYTSNSSCDIPDAAANCLIGGSQDMSTFNPMSAILGGGKLSFRMGVGNIKVHYVNVDLIASGPPDALFDDTTRNGSSGSGFSAALRFGSGGPTIYDYVIVSVPYSETAGSGLNDTATVNMSIPVFYDDNWNVLWNSTVNGTNATLLAGNNSHYGGKMGDWQNLMGNVSCTTNSAIFNATNPCYINTTTNQIWIRLPHFSGTGPVISGTTLPSSSSDSSSSSSSSGSGGAVAGGFWIKTIPSDSNELKEMGEVSTSLEEKQRVRILIGGEKHHVGVISLASGSATINVSSTTKQATLAVNGEKKFDVNDDGYYDLNVKLKSIALPYANFTFSSLYEKIDGAEEEQSSDAPSPESDREKDDGLQESFEVENVRDNSSSWPLVIGILVALLIIGIAYMWRIQRNH